MLKVRLKLSEPLRNNDKVMIMILQVSHIQKELSMSCRLERTFRTIALSRRQSVP